MSDIKDATEEIEHAAAVNNVHEMLQTAFPDIKVEKSKEFVLVETPDGPRYREI